MNALHVRAPQADVLIAGCPAELAARLSRTVTDLGCRVVVLDSTSLAAGLVPPEPVQVCICDARLDEATLAQLWKRLPEQTQYLWLQAESGGSVPPFPAEVVSVDLTPRDWGYVLKLVTARSGFRDRLTALETRLQRALFRNLVCHSPAMQELRRQLYQHGSRETPLVLLGETGVDFAKAAWSVHHAGARCEAPYLAIDASTLSAELFEQQLFLAADTVDGEATPPLLEQLDGGTLFIQNADVLARTTQKKLVRFIESPAIARPETLAFRYINLRIIVGSSAAPRDRAQAPLLQYLAERRDAGQVVIPALRERLDDLRGLCEEILTEQSGRLGVLPPALDESALALIAAQPWPGNDEQLTRVLTNIAQSARRTGVSAADIDVWLGDAQPVEATPLPGLSLAEMERQLIEATFARCAGNREKTAQLLGIGLRTLSGKLRQYGYPPRGGPGSNRTRERIDSPSEQRRAA